MTVSILSSSFQIVEKFRRSLIHADLIVCGVSLHSTHKLKDPTFKGMTIERHLAQYIQYLKILVYNVRILYSTVKMPKELQLDILGDFRGFPQDVRSKDLDRFGKLERNPKTSSQRCRDRRFFWEVCFSR